ncbi:hypothetical protein [Brevibacillus choshinensis]|uniref:Uncharacterized protein n=1 Tax=Brevibacillus choshinensis TaxID=54911 RepID=A0ABX7FRI1_BRECH|nr:hypothetical protein [Brevibacillus choshinensis]QRG68863.1 hypothetical protein JNE38_06875 [Brevibacillus choshinensis]
MMKRLYAALFICTLFSVSLIGCTDYGVTNKQAMERVGEPTVNDSSHSYVNDQYGFRFSLPETWKDYSIVTGMWEGLAAGGEAGETTVETGPMISIRHPQWTPQNQRQDIPIMIFTLDQWNSLLNGKFHIGAAPVEPTELGRNRNYVFALPARYNNAFPQGYEEVEEIIKGNPLHPIQNK